MAKGRPSGFGGFGTTSQFGAANSSVSTSTVSSTGGCCDSNTKDVRDEFDKLVFGTGGCTRRGYPIQFWKTRRNSDGSPQACTCSSTREHDPDRHCSYCRGVGYLWDAEWTMTRSEPIGSEGGLSAKDRWMPGGIVAADTKVFFLRYSIEPRKDDTIVECLLDVDGNVVTNSDQPTFVALYRPQTIIARRDQLGRVEFWEVYCLESEAIRPNSWQA